MLFATRSRAASKSLWTIFPNSVCWMFRFWSGSRRMIYNVSHVTCCVGSIAAEISNLFQILENVFECLLDRFAEIDELRLSIALLNAPVLYCLLTYI
jgi:hypothetical protein